MSDEPQKKSPIEVHSDEDWKDRVKAEDAKADEQFAQQTPPPADAPAPQEAPSTPTSNASPAVEPTPHAPPDATGEMPPLPPPTFEMLVTMFATQALVAMGVVPDPSTGQATRQLPLAKHFIDLLGVLEEKSKGNLTDSEETMIDANLHQLRLAYVELMKQPDA